MAVNMTLLMEDFEGEFVKRIEDRRVAEEAAEKARRKKASRKTKKKVGY